MLHLYIHAHTPNNGLTHPPPPAYHLIPGQFGPGSSPDGNSIVAGGADNNIRVWRFVSREKPQINPMLIARFAHEAPIIRLAFSPDGRRLVCGGLNSLTIWSCSSNDCEPLVRKEGTTSRCLAISPDGKTIAQGCDDGTVRLLDGHTPEVDGRLLGAF